MSAEPTIAQRDRFDRLEAIAAQNREVVRRVAGMPAGDLHMASAQHEIRERGRMQRARQRAKKYAA